jgi:hypothetical protein
MAVTPTGAAGRFDSVFPPRLMTATKDDCFGHDRSSFGTTPRAGEGRLPPTLLEPGLREHDRGDPFRPRRDAMSYLLQYVRRRSSNTPHTPLARVDEYTLLNRPGLYGDAFVRVFVENSTARGRCTDPELVLKIGDCFNVINLEFSLETEELRENSLFKVDTLLGALHRFRDSLAAEAELASRRDR